MGFLARFFSRPLRKELEGLLRSTGVLVFLRLVHKYTPEYGEEKSISIASAVTNELFGNPPTNDIGRQFLSDNQNLVSTKIKELKDEPQICEIVSILLNAKFVLASGSGTISPELLVLMDKLKQYGILNLSDNLTLDQVRNKVKEFEVS